MAMQRPHAPKPARVRRELASFAPRVDWWGAIMDPNDAKEVAIQVERNRAVSDAAHAKISAHERECERRYTNIEKALDKGEERFDELDDKLDQMFKDQNAKLDALVHRHTQAQWSMNWKAWAVAGSIIMILVGAVSWMAGELYHDVRAPVAVASKTG